jgi:hypothetical protein
LKKKIICLHRENHEALALPKSAATERAFKTALKPNRFLIVSFNGP